MAKIQRPLLSLDATGTLGNMLGFVRAPGAAVARSIARIRANALAGRKRPATAAQADVRARWSDGCLAWAALSEAQRADYRAWAEPLNLTGFNLFMRDFDQTPPIPWASGQLLNGGTSAAFTSTNTAAVAAQQNRLLLFAVSTRSGDGADTQQPTLQGLGLTWEVVGSILYDRTTPSKKRLTLFRAWAANSSAGALTISVASQQQTHAAWGLRWIEGAAGAADNGASAILQALPAYAQPLSGTTFSIQLASAPLATSITAAVFADEASTSTPLAPTADCTEDYYTAASPYVDIYAVSSDVPARTLGYQNIIDNAATGGIAFELAKSA